MLRAKLLGILRPAKLPKASREFSGRTAEGSKLPLKAFSPWRTRFEVNFSEVHGGGESRRQEWGVLLAGCLFAFTVKLYTPEPQLRPGSVWPVLFQ